MNFKSVNESLKVLLAKENLQEEDIRYLKELLEQLKEVQSDLLVELEDRMKNCMNYVDEHVDSIECSCFDIYNKYVKLAFGCQKIDTENSKINPILKSIRFFQRLQIGFIIAFVGSLFVPPVALGLLLVSFLPYTVWKRKLKNLAKVVVEEEYEKSKSDAVLYNVAVCYKKISITISLVGLIECMLKKEDTEKLREFQKEIDIIIEEDVEARLKSAKETAQGMKKVFVPMELPKQH